MRLTCPNCAAQYEVDGSLIPDDGRDVQCSNCGKTWFELPPGADSTETPSPVVAAPMNDAPDPDEGRADDWGEEAEPSAPEAEEQTEDTTEEAQPVEAEATDQSKDDPDLDDVDITEAPEVIEADPPTGKPKRREVNPRALDILKEEADRELARRKAEREERVETQSEFNLAGTDDGETPSRALRARMARLRGESEPRPQSAPAEEEDAYRPPQRELLPDIDEINSSLRPADADGDDGEAQRRSSFRRGFGTMIAIAAVLIIAYIAAPAIARSLPGTEGMMTAYVDAANGFRDMIDGIVR